MVYQCICGIIVLLKLRIRVCLCIFVFMDVYGARITDRLSTDLLRGVTHQQMLVCIQLYKEKFT